MCASAASRAGGIARARIVGTTIGSRPPRASLHQRLRHRRDDAPEEDERERADAERELVPALEGEDVGEEELVVRGERRQARVGSLEETEGVMAHEEERLREVVGEPVAQVDEEDRPAPDHVREPKPDRAHRDERHDRLEARRRSGRSGRDARRRQPLAATSELDPESAREEDDRDPDEHTAKEDVGVGEEPIEPDRETERDEPDRGELLEPPGPILQRSERPDPP